MRRNPIRAQEIETTRVEKIEKIQLLVKQGNDYLCEHIRAKASVSKSKVEEMINKFRLSEVVTVGEKQASIISEY